MVDVVVGIESGQWEPLEGLRKMSVLHSLPKQTAPLDMVVTVVVSATDGLTGVLQLAENEGYDYCPEDEKEGVNCGFRSEETASAAYALNLRDFYPFIADIRHTKLAEVRATARQKVRCTRFSSLLTPDFRPSLASEAFD